MSIARHHAEWLSLVEVSGPFLSMPVLLRVFPQGLDAHDAEVSRGVRRALEEWQDNQQGLRPDPAIHTAWVRFVLREVLGFPDELIWGSGFRAQGSGANPASGDTSTLPHIAVPVAEHGEVLRPNIVIARTPSGLNPEPRTLTPRLLIQIVPPTQDLDKPLKDHRWKASPATRMAELLRGAGVRLGLLTNGERWMLVHAQPGETAGFSSWYASLWLDEPVTLRAFRSLLGVARLYGVADPDTLEALLTESAANQQEVTDQLGYQVREAVEVLVQTFDRIDKDQGRALLRGVREPTLYEAALTVMMRLVFLFSAEERGLLLLGKPMYDQHYAISTLRAQLRAAADETGEEVLERRHDAWSRLLATFRAVFGGVQHEDLRLPAYGGHLFDPDRFPFLEGRPDGSRKAAKSQSRDSNSSDLSVLAAWREARPLPVDNRTVLHLLEALQVLRVSVPGGGPAEPRRLSFRALDIEQIGHVYEGLLDHTAKRAAEPVLGLIGSKDREPEVPLAKLESFVTQGRKAVEPDISSRKAAEPQSRDTKNSDLGVFAPLREQKELIDFLRDATGRSASALEKALVVVLEPHDLDALRAACDNDAALVARVRPFAGLLRRDTFGCPVVITAGSVYVTAGTDRRSSGTHYTPRSLTEPIVQHTLDPLVYHGPAEGLPKEQWALHPAERILALQVCDMAMGSGAFLVQTCRYLSERLVEAIEAEDSSRKAAKPQSRDSNSSDLSVLAPLREPVRLPGLSVFAPLRETNDPEERLAIARKLIADRCLYGVDKNPLAVEMAKLSLWLVTLQKDRPFSFLDHALRAGDSLLGLAHIDQLLHWSLARDSGPVTATFLTEPLRRALQRAIALRRRIRETAVIDVRDAERKAGWLREAEDALGLVRLAADLLVAAALHPDKKRRAELSDEFQYRMSLAAEAWESTRVNPTLRPDANREELADLRREADALLAGRQPFHWPLEFPEVFDPDNGSRKDAEPQRRDLMGGDLGVFAALHEELPGFAAIVGNPPFQGGQKITGALGVPYRDYLVEYLACGRRGSADLCAYFFLRAGGMLRLSGQAGLIATNTIAQGDTREVGLDQLVGDGYVIPRAVPSRPWPGLAAVEVAHVWVRRGEWYGPYALDDLPVAAISPFLTMPGLATGMPFRLKANEGKSFQGSIVLGMGFVLEPEEAQSLIDKDPRNREALFPYINGEDLNSRPDQSPSRWVINFHDWPLERAESYPDLMQIVREKVKPERDTNKRTQRRERWWQYAERAPALYTTIAGMERVLVLAQVSRTLAFTFAPNDIVYSHKIVAFALPQASAFAVLQSNFHAEWAWNYSSTMKSDLSYSPSDVLTTFPFPACLIEDSSRKGAKPQSASGLSDFAALREPSGPALREPSGPALRETLDRIGEAYHTHRAEIMRSRQEGLTKTYNRFHSPDEASEEIAELRRLHVAMDQAVAAAYGWGDPSTGSGQALDLGHGFHQTKQGLRYTISEEARRTVLDRLLALNHQRYAEEEAEGLHDKKDSRKGAKPQRRGKGKAAAEAKTPRPEPSVEQGELF